MSVSFYEAAENWWTSKLIRKRHGAAVTAMAWHPNNALLATACMDAKCRVLNAFVDKVRSRRPARPPVRLPAVVGRRGTVHRGLALRVDAPSAHRY